MTRDLVLQAALALVGVAAVAFAIGWFAPISRPNTTRARTPATPAFVHPGAVIAEAARRLGAAEVVADAPQAEEPDTSIDITDTRPPPPPPPIDIAVRLRSELIAVIVEGGQSVALLKAEDGPARRAVAGEAYCDGWRLREIAADAIVIARRGEERRVAVMGDHPGVQIAGTTETGEAPRQRLVLSRQDARTRRP